jgi:ubiquinone/menaquinone biosynthesis C-methylase UbiE
MSARLTREECEPNPTLRFGRSRTIGLATSPSDVDLLGTGTDAVRRPPRNFFEALIVGIRRRWRRERRRRKVGRAYDMALEIARVIPRGSEVLDVGCGHGFIAHHLSAMLGKSVLGIDLANSAEAPIDYRRFDGARFPLADSSVDAVLLCYVLHHAQDVSALMSEAQRVLRTNGIAVIYEDIPQNRWDKCMCWLHRLKWRARTGPCTFRLEGDWRTLFKSFSFEIVTERSLSRWRNLTHPISRKLYLLLAPARPYATN